MAESNNLMQALQMLIESETSQMNTAVDAIIEQYDSGIASVKPLPKRQFVDGTSLDFPVIPNVPVVWPRFAGDSAGVKGPIRSGDKCLLIFCQQAVDGSDDGRRFSLNDAYCVVGAFGKSHRGGAENDRMQLYFGEAYIALTEEGKLLINAPAGVEINTPETQINGSLSASGDIQAGGISTQRHVHTAKGDGKPTGPAQ